MKHLYTSLLVFIHVFFLAGSMDAFCQEHLIRGIVVDDVTGKGVEYAYILNFSLHESKYSNIGGEFSIQAREGDTLVLYGIGYFYQKVIVNIAMLDKQLATDFPLKQQTYNIAEARILGFGTYDDFRQQFMDLDLAESKTKALNNYIAEIARNEGKEAYDMALASGELKPPAPGIPILTPEEIERIKLAGIIEKETVRDQIYQKFNPMMVKKVTGLDNDDEIIEFMVFCNFPDKYLLEVNEYDLMARIALKFDMFKRKKLDEKLLENPVNCIMDRMNSTA